MINLGRIPTLALDGGLELMSATEQTFVDAVNVYVAVVAVLTVVTVADVLAGLDVLDSLGERGRGGPLSGAGAAAARLPASVHRRPGRARLVGDRRSAHAGVDGAHDVPHCRTRGALARPLGGY